MAKGMGQRVKRDASNECGWLSSYTVDTQIILDNLNLYILDGKRDRNNC